MPTRTVFPRAVANVLDHEGGYVNDPDDPGGETNFGISKRAYPKLDIAALTMHDATDVYMRDYWTPIKGDQLPADIAVYLLDMAVNMGTSRSIRMLQTVAGVEADGVIGPQTINAAKAPGTLQRLDMARLRYYQSLTHFVKYGRGWTKRAAETFRLAQDTAKEYA